MVILSHISLFNEQYVNIQCHIDYRLEILRVHLYGLQNNHLKVVMNLLLRSLLLIDIQCKLSLCCVIIALCILYRRRFQVNYPLDYHSRPIKSGTITTKGKLGPPPPPIPARTSPPWTTTPAKTNHRRTFPNLLSGWTSPLMNRGGGGNCPRGGCPWLSEGGVIVLGGQFSGGWVTFRG